MGKLYIHVRQSFVYGPWKMSHKYFILASQYLHENTPHIKSVLLSGPEGSGKTMLVHAICNELKATFFDLTVILNLGFRLDIYLQLIVGSNYWGADYFKRWLYLL